MPHLCLVNVIAELIFAYRTQAVQVEPYRLFEPFSLSGVYIAVNVEKVHRAPAVASQIQSHASRR
jgi:hypothetical protein